jgi:hypothetical protein
MSTAAISIILVSVFGCRGWVQRQFFQQTHNLFIITDIIPGKSKVLLMLLQSVHVPMKVARLDSFGLVM